MVIKSISYDQHEIIANIIKLHCPTAKIDVDPTYSKGNFYKNKPEIEPDKRFDLYPQDNHTEQANANNLPLADKEVASIMFDPPFIVGHTKDKPTGIMGKRFYGFRYIKDLWQWYDECIIEFNRILIKSGVLIFKCQDTVSSGKNWFSHCHIIQKAEESGFYTKDLFILLAKTRAVGHNHANQKHARKFHSYFIVFEKIEDYLRTNPGADG